MRTIVITGPEACGKSELTQALSSKRNAYKVLEYARWYLPGLPRPYLYEDLLAISRGQEREVLRITHAHHPRDYLFIDTWAIVLMIWSEYKFGKSHPTFFRMLKQYNIDHFLLCAPDLEWTDDPLRENPNDREELFQLYKDKLSQFGLPYTIIKGEGDNRVKNAIDALGTLE